MSHTTTCHYNKRCGTIRFCIGEAMLISWQCEWSRVVVVVDAAAACNSTRPGLINWVGDRYESIGCFAWRFFACCLPTWIECICNQNLITLIAANLLNNFIIMPIGLLLSKRWTHILILQTFAIRRPHIVVRRMKLYAKKCEERKTRLWAALTFMSVPWQIGDLFVEVQYSTHLWDELHKYSASRRNGFIWSRHRVRRKRRRERSRWRRFPLQFPFARWLLCLSARGLLHYLGRSDWEPYAVNAPVVVSLCLVQPSGISLRKSVFGK